MMNAALALQTTCRVKLIPTHMAPHLSQPGNAPALDDSSSTNEGCSGALNVSTMACSKSQQLSSLVTTIAQHQAGGDAKPAWQHKAKE